MTSFIADIGVSGDAIFIYYTLDAILYLFRGGCWAMVIANNVGKH